MRRALECRRAAPISAIYGRMISCPGSVGSHATDAQSLNSD
jgi:hypothetical protein